MLKNDMLTFIKQFYYKTFFFQRSCLKNDMLTFIKHIKKREEKKEKKKTT